MSGRRIFGLNISSLTASQIAAKVVDEPPPGSGPGLIVTPNIQHIALLHGNPAFRRAYDDAAEIVCDGFPVHYYAKLRGAPSPGRVTGCDIAMDIMGRRSFPAQHRFFFVVDTEAAATAVRAWAEERSLACQTAVPDFGFEKDDARSDALVEAIRAHRTTILFMGLGAPKSEVFVEVHRDRLPACWALCVGQAVKMALGLTPTPPGLVKILNLEWAWRVILEPRRLIGRYVYSAGGFLAAVARDLR
ncbi:MAG: WecB/TagA/CpsF family glycosyltransferase [Rhodospirillaceae bacterium]